MDTLPHMKEIGIAATMPIHLWHDPIAGAASLFDKSKIYVKMLGVESLV
jgi:hypothetical protein